MTFLCFLAALGLFFAALPLPGVRAAVVENDAFAGEHSQRILMSDTRIACIRQLMTDDPLMAELLIKIREAAEVNLTLPPNTHLKPARATCWVNRAPPPAASSPARLCI